MRKALIWLAPRSRLDILWKGLFYCACIILWHFTWTRGLKGDDTRPAGDLVLDALVVGGPFAFLFALGSWTQVTGIRSLIDRAHRDPLSGLLNRQTFASRAASAIAGARTGMFLLIDADHFKAVNDQFGHAVGDRCIAAIGHRLKWHLRESDIAGRIGGEEFAIFMPDVGAQHARVVAARVAQPVTFTSPDNDALHSITLSVGAVFLKEERVIDALFARADEALYRAKANGRSRIVFADGSPDIDLSGGRDRRRAASPPVEGHRGVSRLMSRAPPGPPPPVAPCETRASATMRPP